MSNGLHCQSELQRQGHGCRELIITHVGWGIIVIDIGKQKFECNRIKYRHRKIKEASKKPIISQNLAVSQAF